MTTNIKCVYCKSCKSVKLREKTGEQVCLACRLSFLADEFEQVASKEDVEQVKYYAQLLEQVGEQYANQ